jgi:hypothetical protein
MTRTFRRSGGLAVLVAAAAFGLAGCGGSGSGPHVASLQNSSGHGSGTATTNTSSGGSSGSALPKGSPTQLLNEWAACMRSHGDSGQTDPAITAGKVIDITWNPAIPGGYNGTNKGGQGNSGPGQYCRSYLAAAQRALGGDQANPRVSFAELLKYSECMRANGIADFPDPTTSGGHPELQLSVGGDTDPSNPAYRNAAQLCARKTGVRALGVGPLPPGTIELNGQGPGGAG